MTVTLTIQLISTLALLAAGFWNRRRDRREISRLASELAACRSTLHEFMQETEATFAVFSRMVHRAEPPNGARVAPPATNRIPPANTPGKARAAAAAAASAAALPARRGAGKKAEVLKLADTGMAAAEIASQLTIPQGEIDLILNLNGREARC
jgi:type II secretory pathway pseudopilin PulG